MNTHFVGHLSGSPRPGRALRPRGTSGRGVDSFEELLRRAGNARVVKLRGARLEGDDTAAMNLLEVSEREAIPFLGVFPCAFVHAEVPAPVVREVVLLDVRVFRAR